jgi:hypothetical protein
MHRPETKIETEVKILYNKLSPWKSMHRIKWRICETTFLPIASTIYAVKTEHTGLVLHSF